MQKQNKFRVVTLISGRGSNLEALLASIKDYRLPIELSCVISDVASAAGLEIARSYGVKTELAERGVDSKEEFFSRIANIVEKYDPQLVILAGFMRVVTSDFLRRFADKVINIHPSLLPNFKGLHAQKQALEAKAAVSGCTVHFVSPEVDSGAIIAQASVPVLSDDDVDSLSARILVEEHHLLPAVVYAMSRGALRIDNGEVVIDEAVKCIGGNRTIKSVAEQILDIERSA